MYRLNLELLSTWSLLMEFANLIGIYIQRNSKMLLASSREWKLFLWYSLILLSLLVSTSLNLVIQINRIGTMLLQSYTGRPHHHPCPCPDCHNKKIYIDIFDWLENLRREDCNSSNWTPKVDYSNFNNFALSLCLFPFYKHDLNFHAKSVWLKIKMHYW